MTAITKWDKKSIRSLVRNDAVGLLGSGGFKDAYLDVWLKYAIPRINMDYTIFPAEGFVRGFLAFWVRNFFSDCNKEVRSVCDILVSDLGPFCWSETHPVNMTLNVSDISSLTDENSSEKALLWCYQ